MPRKKKVADIEEIASVLTAIMRGEAVGDGDPPGIKDQLKATELLGKHYGMFKPKEEVPGQIEFFGDEDIAD